MKQVTKQQEAAIRIAQQAQAFLNANNTSKLAASVQHFELFRLIHNELGNEGLGTAINTVYLCKLIMLVTEGYVPVFTTDP